MVTPDDLRSPFMERALFLAERGRGRTTPNPIVGAVVVSADGVVVGQGAHLVAGGAARGGARARRGRSPRARRHALLHARAVLPPRPHRSLRRAHRRRPASHASSSRSRDPNPLVAGRGLTYLRGGRHRRDRRRGRGRGTTAARAVLHVDHRAPAVRDRSRPPCRPTASSAGRPGRVKLTGAGRRPVLPPRARRGRCDRRRIRDGPGRRSAADGPRRLSRSAAHARHLRLALRMPPSARVFSTLAAGPVIMIVSRRGRPRRIGRRGRPSSARRRGRGASRLAICVSALESLAARGVLSLLVEGGPTLHAAFADGGAGRSRPADRDAARARVRRGCIDGDERAAG